MRTRSKKIVLPRASLQWQYNVWKISQDERVGGFHVHALDCSATPVVADLRVVPPRPCVEVAVFHNLGDEREREREREVLDMERDRYRVSDVSGRNRWWHSQLAVVVVAVGAVAQRQSQ